MQIAISFHPCHGFAIENRSEDPRRCLRELSSQQCTWLMPIQRHSTPAKKLSANPHVRIPEPLPIIVLKCIARDGQAALWVLRITRGQVQSVSIDDHGTA